MTRDLQGMLLAELLTGQWVSIEDFSVACNCKSRTVRDLILQLQADHPICYNKDRSHVYWATRSRDLMDTHVYLANCKIKIERALKRGEQYMRELPP